MQVLKKLAIFFLISGFFINIIACASSIQKQLRDDNSDFFEVPLEPESNEAFRVLITSDGYVLSQTNYKDTLEREQDIDGDKYMCEKLDQYNMVDVTREAKIALNLYPDTGKMMKIRPRSLTNIMEIDNLIVEDIKRWNLKYPDGIVGPNSITINYRVILQKSQSDEDIMKEVKEKVREEEEKKGRNTSRVKKKRR